jgi:hypothetical protein
LLSFLGQTLFKVVLLFEKDRKNLKDDFKSFDIARSDVKVKKYRTGTEMYKKNKNSFSNKKTT